MTIDFKIAIHKAVTNVWPNSKIVDCRFHLTQSSFRQIQNIGLINEYKNESSEIRTWLKYTFGLVFLNPEDVES